MFERSVTIFTVIAAMMLIVPYGTGAIQYLFNTAGTLPIRPMFYMLVMGSLLAAGVVIKRPKLSLPAVCLLTLLGIRTIDAVVFNRVVLSTSALSTPSSNSLAILFFAGCFWLACGNVVAIRWATILSAVAMVVITSGFNIYEWRNPGTFSAVMGRSAGMLGNPNVAAQNIAFCLALLAYMGLRPTLLTPLFVVGSVAIYFTLSRGGWLLVGLLAILYLIFTFRTQRRLIITGLIVAVVAGGLAYQLVDFDPLVTDINVRQRMAIFQGRGEMDIDDTGRLTLLKKGVEGLLERPLTGFGTSAAAEMFAPHNMFLAVGIDSGLLGLILFTGGFFLLFREAVLRRPDLFLVLVPMIVSAQLSHNLTEDIVFVLCWLICSLPIKGEAFPLTPRVVHEHSFFPLRRPLRAGSQPKLHRPQAG